MKKLLLASTALVATAGAASAQDIALSGMAEMGIFGGQDIDTQFFTDVDVTFTMSGEADNGLTFGASIDLDESDGDPSGAFGPATQGGEAIFVSFGGATLTMGDTDGALDARVPEMALAGGSLADDETIHAGFFTADGADGIYDGQVARFDYTFSSFTFSLSAEQDSNGAGDEPTIGVGVSYAGAFSGVDVNVGLGYQGTEDLGNWTSLAGTAGFANGLSAGLTFARYDDETAADADIDHYGVGLGYEMNALAIGVNYGRYEVDGGNDSEGYGLAATYDLGGGFELRAGYGYSDVDNVGDSDTFSMGARMNF